jgi:hypothetical protein
MYNHSITRYQKPVSNPEFTEPSDRSPDRHNSDLMVFFIT